MSSYPLLVGAVMTAIPETITVGASTASALALMDKHGVRHLPVLDEGQLVGLLSHRDLERSRAFLDSSPGVVGPNVGALCSRALLCVELDEALDTVATKMADHKLGSALVLDGEELVGIVTTIDMCRCVADLVGRVRALQTTA